MELAVWAGAAAAQAHKAAAPRVAGRGTPRAGAFPRVPLRVSCGFARVPLWAFLFFSTCDRKTAPTSPTVDSVTPANSVVVRCSALGLIIIYLYTGSARHRQRRKATPPAAGLADVSLN